MVLLLFNRVDNICFQFVKTRSELAEVFIEEPSHTCKNISDLLRDCGTERSFKMRLHSFYDLLCVPLVKRIERYESVLEFQYFSDEDLHFILGILALALNNIAIS